MRYIIPSLLLMAIAGCTNREAACIAAAREPLIQLDSQIANLDARLIAGEVPDRRAGVVRLAELQATKARADQISQARIAECRKPQTRGL